MGGDGRGIRIALFAVKTHAADRHSDEQGKGARGRQMSLTPEPGKAA
jgi:hypothetical protein